MELIVDDHYISALTSWGDLDWSLCWPGYSDELTFDVASHPSIFKPGKIVSLVWGATRLWTGTLDEPVRGQKLRAAGLHRLGEKYAALTSGGDLSTWPAGAVDAAIVRGMPWIRSVADDMPIAPINTDSPSTITEIVNVNTAQFPGWDWGVLPGRQYVRRERAVPRLHVRPGGDGLGIAWDNYASTLIARYFDSASSTYQTAIVTDATAQARWGYREVIVPNALNDGAAMSAAQATAALDSMLAAGRNRPGWTAPIEVEYGAILNSYQQPVDLATIKPYETIRVHGLADDVADLDGQSYVDMPLARINHSGGPKVVLTPVGLVSPMVDVLSGKRAA